MGKRRFDTKGSLSRHFPILFELLAGSDLDWKKIDTRLEQKLDDHKRKYERANSAVLVPTSFFGIIVASVTGNAQATSFLTFIRRIFEELTDKLDNEEKRLIRDNVFGMLSNIDEKYHNFLGELCVLNHVKRNTNFKLQETEVPVDSSQKHGPKIDFSFIAPQDSKKLLVEVMNIHLHLQNTLTSEKIHKSFFSEDS